MVQFRASPSRIPNSTASLFRTGSVPGRPRQTGQVFVLGERPKAVVHPQKIFEPVRSWA